MARFPYFELIVRPRSEGVGWEIETREYSSVSDLFHPEVSLSDPIIDPTLLVAEVARLTATMALGREAGGPS